MTLPKMWTGPSGNFPADGSKYFVTGVTYDSFALRAIPNRNTSRTQAIGGQGRKRTGESQNKLLRKRRKRMLNKLKKNNKKGFTLVELIVVLVILAILAALLIPALTGYIDKAKEKQIIAETRQAVMAAQTLVDEKYATKAAGGTISIGGSSADVNTDDIKALAEVTGTLGTIEVDKVEITSGSGLYKVIIKSLEYTNNSKKCTYTAAATDKYAVTAAP